MCACLIKFMQNDVSIVQHCTVQIFIFVNCLGQSRYFSHMDYKIKRRGIYVCVCVCVCEYKMCMCMCIYINIILLLAAAEEMNLYL